MTFGFCGACRFHSKDRGPWRWPFYLGNDFCRPHWETHEPWKVMLKTWQQKSGKVWCFPSFSKWNYTNPQNPAGDRAMDLSPCPPIITCFQASTQKLQHLLVLAWWTFSNIHKSSAAQPSLATSTVEFLQSSVLVGHPLGIKGRFRTWEETNKAANEVYIRVSYSKRN